MSTDLDAAVARLEERCRHGELRRVGVVSADVRLLLADWKRLREMTSPAAGLARLEQELGIMDKTIAERDAARAEVERYKQLALNRQVDVDAIVHYRNLAISLGAKPEDMEGTFDRKLCEESAANCKEVAPEGQRALWQECLQMQAELARLRERDAKVRSILQRVDDEACKTDWSGNPDDLPESRPLDNEAVAMDMREALELLKETP